MKRISILIPNMKIGGAQRALISLLNELDLSKVEVTLFLLEKDGDFICDIPTKVRVVFLENYYNFLKHKYNNNFILDIILGILKLDFKFAYRRLVSTIRYLTANKNLHEEQKIWLAVRMLIRPQKLDCDFCVSYMQGSATYFIADKIITSGKKIAMFNTDYMKAGYNALFDKPYFNKIDTIAAVSNEANITLQTCFDELKEKIITIEDVVSPKHIQLKSLENCNLVEDGEDTIIVSCGRIEKNIKGYDLIIEAAKKLSDNNYLYKWYIIGPGSDYHWLKEKINEYKLSEKVILLGALNNPYPIIKKADFFVHAARFEGKGLVLKEAKILGCPIISTNFDTALFEVNNNQNGYIVEMNVDSLYASIEKLLKQPEECNRLRSNITEQKISGIEDYNNLFEI